MKYITKFAIDVQPGDYFDGKQVIAVERLQNGVVLLFAGNKRIYIQGYQSTVLVGIYEMV